MSPTLRHGGAKSGHFDKNLTLWVTFSYFEIRVYGPSPPFPRKRLKTLRSRILSSDI